MPNVRSPRQSVQFQPLRGDTFNLRFGELNPAESTETKDETNPDVLGQWVQNQGASSSFFQTLFDFIRNTVASPILEDIRKVGYSLHLKNNIRQDRPELYRDCDYTGGFHERRHKRMTVAEKILLFPTREMPDGEWVPNRYWQNAVVHEFGHAICYNLGQREADRLASKSPDGTRHQQQEYRYWGISESPPIVSAWEKDFQALPESFRKEAFYAFSKDKIGYFMMREVKDGQLTDNFAPGRQEIFAEAFDILMRGQASTYNYETFTQHFPNLLKAVRQTVEDAYGIRLPARDVVP